MRLIFIGTSHYGIPALEALRQDGCTPIMVISQPDRPAGRGLSVVPSPIALFSRICGLPLYTPEDINSASSIDTIAQTKPDIIVTASYGGMIGKKLRALTPHKAINLHPSLLPKYRGATPIETAILSGDEITGTTIFRLVAALDAGPILMQHTLPVLPNENKDSLLTRLSGQAAQMLLKLLAMPYPWQETPQDESKATWSRKLSPADELINWQQPADSIINQIRALSQLPGAHTFMLTPHTDATKSNSLQLKILEAIITDLSSTGTPGQVTNIIKNKGFTVNCLDSQILVTQVQAAGKKAMSAAAFINGARLIPGEILGKG